MKAKYGVFLEPENELRDLVSHLKTVFKKVESTAPYLNHFIHSTFFVFETDESNIEAIQSDLEITLSRVNSFVVTSKDWKIFENDLLTGGNTLCVEIERSDKLLNLQMIIANKLLPYVDIPETKSDFRGAMLASFEKYGYPFVGSHWIPHLTVGSFKTSSEELYEIVNSLKLNSMGIEHKVVDLSLRRIKGHKHELISRFTLID